MIYSKLHPPIFSYINYEFSQKNAWPGKRPGRKNQNLQDQRNPLLSRKTNSQPQVNFNIFRLADCTISFGKEDGHYFIDYSGQKGESYQLPVHLNMNPVVFVINRNGK